MTIIPPTKEEFDSIIEMENSSGHSWPDRGWRSLRRWVNDTNLYTDDEIISHMKNLGFFVICGDEHYWSAPWDNDPDFYLDFTMLYCKKSAMPHLFFYNEIDAMHYKLISDQT